MEDFISDLAGDDPLGEEASDFGSSREFTGLLRLAGGVRLCLRWPGKLAGLKVGAEKGAAARLG